ncbi:MAG: hypothetical protein ABUS49_10235 [Acidobacteriota bacterium]
MRHPLLRFLLITEFLIAIQVVFTFWTQVGGQYHLDLMFWPWKFALSLLAAALIVAITAGHRVRLAVALLVLTAGLAGMVTYYYHLHEPADEEQDYQDQPARIKKIVSGSHGDRSD